MEDTLRGGDDVGHPVAAALGQALGPELGILGGALQQIQFQALQLGEVKTRRVGAERDALSDELRGLLGQALGQDDVGRRNSEPSG